MASGSYRQVDVGCPFYKFDDGQRKITCEGIVEGSSVVLTYLRKEDYVKQMEVFCQEHYPKCEVYRMLMEKYEDCA